MDLTGAEGGASSPSVRDRQQGGSEGEAASGTAAAVFGALTRAGVEGLVFLAGDARLVGDAGLTAGGTVSPAAEGGHERV